MDKRARLSDKLIRIDNETAKALDLLKVHPRQSYDEVIQGLIKGMEKAIRR